MKTTNMLMLMAMLLISACSKNGNEPEQIKEEPIAKTCQIVSVQEEGEQASTYTYDEIGRVSKVFRLYGFGNGTFTYLSNKVIFTGSGSESQSFNLDEQGRISTNDYDTYKYNSDGYLAEKNDASTPVEFALSYSEGNLKSVVIDGVENVNVTYYEEPNQNLLGFENPLYSSLLFNIHTFSNLLATFTGKPNRNLVKAIILTRKNHTTGKEEKLTETFTYKKDEDGKITKLTQTHDRPGENVRIYTITFTYNCP